MKLELVKPSLSIPGVYRNCMPIVISGFCFCELFAKCGESIARGALIVVHKDESISFALRVLP